MQAGVLVCQTPQGAHTSRVAPALAGCLRLHSLQRGSWGISCEWELTQCPSTPLPLHPPPPHPPCIIIIITALPSRAKPHQPSTHAIFLSCSCPTARGSQRGATRSLSPQARTQRRGSRCPASPSACSAPQRAQPLLRQHQEHPQQAQQQRRGQPPCRQQQQQQQQQQQ